MQFMRGILLLFFFAFAAQLAGQTGRPGTIRVKKESDLSKAVLDNTEHRLMVVDRFGNPRENEIISYTLYVKSGRQTKQFPGFNNKLTAEMISYLNRQKSAVKIFFTGITAKDDNGHPVKLPDVIETWFPDCGNCGNRPQRR